MIRKYLIGNKYIVLFIKFLYMKRIKLDLKELYSVLDSGYIKFPHLFFIRFFPSWVDNDLKRKWNDFISDTFYEDYISFLESKGIKHTITKKRFKENTYNFTLFTYLDTHVKSDNYRTSELVEEFYNYVLRFRN